MQSYILIYSRLRKREPLIVLDSHQRELDFCVRSTPLRGTESRRKDTNSLYSTITENGNSYRSTVKGMVIVYWPPKQMLRLQIHAKGCTWSSVKLYADHRKIRYGFRYMQRGYGAHDNNCQYYLVPKNMSRLHIYMQTGGWVQKITQYIYRLITEKCYGFRYMQRGWGEHDS